jgi:hypothetical protein
MNSMGRTYWLWGGFVRPKVFRFSFTEDPVVQNLPVLAGSENL